MRKEEGKVMGKSEAKLWVNDNRIELTEFPEEFLAKTLVGVASSLKGTADIKLLEFDLLHGEVKVIVNGEELTLTPFPNDIIASTLIGLVSSLKGVDKVESLKIKVRTL
jgi:hypothetical protein